MEEKSLKTKATIGIFWSAMENFSVVAVQFLINILLARMLMPSDFGVIGMLAIFIAICQTFVDSGMSQALIRKVDRTESDYSTVFVYNLGLSIFVYTLLFISAPIIAEFYAMPALVEFTRVLSLSIVINSLGLVSLAKLTANLEFKIIAKVNFVSFLVSGLIALLLAYRGFGVWAIVSQTILRSICIVLLLSYYHRWRPSLTFSRASFNALFGFGSKLLAAGVIATLFQNVYKVIIGKRYSATSLGYYSQSYQLADVLSGTVTIALQKVTYPILASIQNDSEKMVSVYRKMIGMTAFVIFPVMTLLSLLADPLIRLLLTDKWLPIVPLLQLLALAKIVYPISAINMNMLNAIGRSDLFLKVDLAKIPITVVALIITVPLGLKAIIIGQIGTSIISFFMNAYVPGKIMKYGAMDQLKDIYRKILATIIMSGVVILIMPMVSYHGYRLIVGGTIGILSYLMSAYLLRINELDESLNAFKTILKSKKG